VASGTHRIHTARFEVDETLAWRTLRRAPELMPESALGGAEWSESTKDSCSGNFKSTLEGPSSKKGSVGEEGGEEEEGPSTIVMLLNLHPHDTYNMKSAP